ncbi:MAG TPA: OmpH family outer membrane protein [Saprospiraceae bacterium]|mgnify:FL=1|nr:OmpH family outer membrane protein [Saprospiraceae bacterium]
MKNLKSFTILLLVFTGIISLSAQKIALVDINAVLENLPEYRQAQSELDRMASEWRQEIAQEMDEIKSLYNRYQAQQVLLSPEAQKEKEDEIVAKEASVRELQRRRFGPEGDLFLKRQELITPIQERIYKVIDEYATERAYDIILDKGGNTGLLFVNNNFDKTEDIRRRLR